MEENNTQFSMFQDKVKFDDPVELKEYIRNGDGPVIIQFLVSILETSNKNGSFSIAESVIMSEVLERASALLALITTKQNKDEQK